MRYTIALSKQKGIKRTENSLDKEEDESSEMMDSEDDDEQMTTESVLVED